ncbi:hypothetical protein TVAG_157440 [Trichomonas vaginalis G3]|uniref:Uncharacterized protein n=1 Tax=Trichomonas vaginalis (strain ATCC PRA-98 / G3) TaxID=412133 RepID=A2E9L6_TRIV3|nr:hypothetical protein TVAGG3_0746320 [Trichomonas vaginalis G3]EAY10667.1 hypothetical protein TVAG_157440 [Trichomonas vaginalis G3]KAI5512191.1 hypothetical protein TVAGG3_0746320 [Trichomonas vaginalis G3]|eukprot:XP_001322890.1 hypothetical protein [Trichomonas vaginalis G3]
MKENFKPDPPITYCFPSSSALQGSVFADIPLPRPSPYDIQQNLIPLPSLKPLPAQPLTQPVSPRTHKSPSPKRCQPLIPISIDNYNPRKRQNFTEEATVIAINMLKVEPSSLFIDPQQPSADQMNYIQTIRTQIKRLRDAILSNTEESREIVKSYYAMNNCPEQSTSEPQANKVVLKSAHNPCQNSCLFDRRSRIESIREKNKATFKRAEEIAQKQKEEFIKRQNIHEQNDKEYKRKLKSLQLKRANRSRSNISDIGFNIVPITF